MSTRISQLEPTAPGRDGRRESLDERLATLFWALLFILAGALWLLPAALVPDGTWLTAIGVILVTLNAVRYLNRVPVRVLPTVLGALALAAGLARLGGAHLPVIPLTLIVVGAVIILELFTPRKS